MNIRPVRRSDYDAWRPLWDGYNAFYGRKGPTALAEEITQATWSRFFEPSEPMHALVAEFEGQVAGITHYLFHRSTSRLHDVCYLQDLFTAEPMRGRGVGRRLIEAVYEAAREAGSSRVYWHTQVGTYTEEPQLQGTAQDGKLTYTLGGYYEYGHNIAPQPYEVDVNAGNFVIVQTNQTNSERSRGLYGQTSYDLGGLTSSLDGLKLTAGYRHTWDDYSYSIASYSPTAGNICLTSPGTYPAADCSFGASGRSSGHSWTAGIAYQWTPNQLVYLRSGRGYTPGGFNPSFGFTPGGVNTPQFTFAPESVVDVELGVKSAFTLGAARGEIAADVFHSHFTNIQRYVSEVLPGGVESNFTANASQAQIEGFELTGRVAPIRSLMLAATYSYNHGKYTRIDPAAAPSLIGVPFAYLPAHKASLSATYTLPLPSNLGEVSTSAFYSYQSRFFDAPVVQPLDYIEGYGLLNARVDWNHVVQSSFDVSFSVTNATDRTYRVGQYSGLLANGYITSFYGEPRMYTVSLRYQFGGH